MEKTLYRIYTEDKNRNQVKAIVSEKFLGYTMFEASGVWNRVEEKSLVIEIVGEESKEIDINKVAKEIKAYNEQEAVLITKSKVKSRLI